MRIFFITLCLSISFAFANSGAVLSSELQKASIDNVNDLEEWKTLAQHGDLDAQFYLATLYREGKGVPQDYKILKNNCHVIENFIKKEENLLKFYPYNISSFLYQKKPKVIF